MIMAVRSTTHEKSIQAVKLSEGAIGSPSESTSLSFEFLGVDLIREDYNGMEEEFSS